MAAATNPELVDHARWWDGMIPLGIRIAVGSLVTDLADALEAATAPRVVTTVAELDALPARAFIREHDGFHRLKEVNGMWLLCIQSGGASYSNEIELPAEVLFTPEATS